MFDQIIKIEISANIIALYGAILATISLLIGIYKIWIDRPRLKFSVDREYEILGTDTNGSFKNIEPGKTFWMIQIINIGRQSIIINSIGIEWRDRKGGALISKDYNGLVQCFELKSGNSRQIVINSALLDINRVKNIYARDATGKSHRYKI